MRILVVEDEPLIRALYEKELSSCGYYVVQAENATEAINIIKAGGKFDLVLTDIDMPGPLNGFKLAEFVKKTTPLAKVIVISGHEREGGVAGSIDVFLGKPTTARRLRDQVALTLGCWGPSPPAGSVCPFS